MKYNSEVVNIGGDALSLYEGIKSLILFNDSVLDESLKDIALVHKSSQLLEDIAVGDEIRIGENELYVTAVGDVALETFKNIGHLTMRFTGSGEVNLPGEIAVFGELKNIKIGDKFTIK
ncbi:PTS glucitol/sorbitol transporter subunit IIA [Gemella sp. zg-1178]|uniref:PTS glucitol/sorbitol transporter subunit IIA n=1 Tax=Gemella sp. zg-1178 TaxID=2840372 RepID=UPI001C049A18|nr:PTS glucitol/sorbitol transporter subunit IIA [Gemella sp. zg-1178]MBU0278443.1 PTS glucitol/sorbitol transporter subunit IIA [Gemella sp. zg-1178]